MVIIFFINNFLLHMFEDLEVLDFEHLRKNVSESDIIDMLK